MRFEGLGVALLPACMTRPGSGILSLMFRRGMTATGLSCSVASLGREILDLASIGRMGLEMLGVGLAARVVVEEARVLVGCCRMLLLLPNLSAMMATRLNHYDKIMGIGGGDLRRKNSL